MREHPELSVGSQTEGVDVRSVGNSMVLKETALIEAFNLKAAIEFTMKNFEAAQEALSDMPPRADDELDPGPTEDRFDDHHAVAATAGCCSSVRCDGAPEEDPFDYDLEVAQGDRCGVLDK